MLDVQTKRVRIVKPLNPLICLLTDQNTLFSPLEGRPIRGEGVCGARSLKEKKVPKMKNETEAQTTVFYNTSVRKIGML